MTKRPPVFQPLARPYGRGYIAPGTSLFNTDRAKLTIGQTRESIVLSKDDHLPPFVDVLVDLIPEQSMARPQIHFDGRGGPIYTGAMQGFSLRAITLTFAGLVRIGGKVCSPSSFITQTVKELPGPLYRHEFDVIESDIHLGPEEEGCWALGGFYREGGSLSSIEQTFISFFDLDGRLSQRQSRLSEWWHKGLRPPEESGAVIRNTTKTRAYMTLEDAIRHGEAQFRLPLGTGADGEEIGATYASMDVSRHGVGKAFVTFKRRK